MKKNLFFLFALSSSLLLNACGGSSGSGQALHIATHFVVTAPRAANAGTAFTLAVNAVDDIGDAANGYSGTVRFTSTDGKAVLPGKVVLAGGSGVFQATLETVGAQTITAADIATTTITGATNSIQVTAGATSLSVIAPSVATAGKAFSFTVTALDVLDHIVTNYPGTATFTSTDGEAILPSNSQLMNGTGSATFSATLNTVGNQTITATDIATASLTGSSSIHVSASASGFTPTGGMSNPRQWHTATLLKDGRVLVVGGDAWVPPGRGRYCQQPVPQPGAPPCQGHYNPLASTELFDPASGSFTGGILMSVPRVFHTATLLQDGKVLVAGGKNTTPYDTAEIFDLSTNSFTPTSNMLSARSGHTATLLANGKVLLASGDAGNGNWSATAELFDPSSGTFTATGSMSVARAGGTATLLKDGRVLFAGGENGNPLETTATAEIFDPATGTFASTGNMNVARSGHTATLLANGKVLLTGGVDASGMVISTAEVFDEVTGVFTATGKMVTARFGQTETLFRDGKVLLIGGLDANKHELSSAEWFDPSNGTFAVAGNMEIERVAHAATLLMNGDVLITGGSNANLGDQRTLASTELFP